MTEQEKREKVIEHLDWAINEPDVFDALYTYDLEGVIDTMRDALELLQAQEPVEAKIGGSADNCWWYTCGGCGEAIDHNDRYCRHCGRAVKWD